jgi:hypothetical protein
MGARADPAAPAATRMERKERCRDLRVNEDASRHWSGLPGRSEARECRRFRYRRREIFRRAGAMPTINVAAMHDLHHVGAATTATRTRHAVRRTAKNTEGRSRGHATRLSGSIGVALCLQQLLGKNLNTRPSGRGGGSPCRQAR